MAPVLEAVEAINIGRPQQLMVPVRVDHPRDVRSSPLWFKAIEALENEPGFPSAPAAWVRLEMPQGIEQAWRVRRNGIPFRCIVMWVMFPTDGDPPGWRGRVDVAWRE